MLAYLIIGVFWFAVVLFTNFFFPDVIPYKTFELWITRGNVIDWLSSALPIFIWAISFTLFVSLITRNNPKANRNAEKVLYGGFLISAWAGVTEEMVFRWSMFMGLIVFQKVINFLIFGWLGFGVTEWMQLHIVGPVTNYITLGYFRDVLTNPGSWAVGAAMLSANAFFRNGHKYQGWLGYLNSWVIGMFFFYILFSYGLIAAIFVHFAYDLTIFFIRYIDHAIERKLGWI